MDRPDVYIVSTGAANIASVAAAIGRAGKSVAVTQSPVDVEQARHVVLPGVGSFEAAMNALRTRDLVRPLQERIEADRPTLAICLGLQLLCDSSEESPGVPGLSIVPKRVTRFTGDVRIPQFGWNRVEADRPTKLLETGYAYFANSYFVPALQNSFPAAHATHGQTFVAALERGHLLACQFHPELSGDYGQRLLERWLRKGASC